jgi:hypothetical protein
MRKIRIGFMCFLATLLAAFAAGCGQEMVTLPGVVSVTPAQGATSVPITTNVTATFSMAMSPGSITSSTFTLAGPGGNVAGAVTYTGVVATFTPNAALAYGTTYTATITNGAAAPGGSELIANYVWSFTTIAPSVPGVVSVTPLPFAQNVPITGAGAIISATFNEAMTSSVDAAFTVAAPGNVAVSGTVTLNAGGTVATFTPAAPLAYSTTYTATITNAAKATDGVAMAGAYVWSFTMIAPAPLVVTTVPVNGALDVPIGQVLSASFSQTMNPTTLNATTFTLSVTGGAAVLGTVTPSVTAATFLPNAPLLNNTSYTATITTGATSMAGIPLATSYSWQFTTITMTPMVTGVLPLNGDTTVPIAQVLSATFNEAMNPATLNAATFTLIGPGGVNVPGGVLPSGSGVAFKPTNDLAYSSFYVATITTGAQDLAGTGLATDYVWTFSTLSPALAVVSTKPLNTATGVPVDQLISATFNEPMTCPLAVGAFTLTGPGLTVVNGTIGCTGSVVTFSPTSLLAPNTLFTATFNSTTKDTAGTLLSNPPFTWTFLTLAAPTQPTVIHTDPLNLATGVLISQAVTATFSEAMDPATINSATFTLTVTGGATVNGVITYVPNGSIATFTPDSPLLYNTNYTATVNAGALDFNDDAAVVPYTWTFMTALAPVPVVPYVVTTDPPSPPQPEDMTVPLNQIVSATFSEPMNPATINSTTFTLTAAGSPTPVTGLVAYAAISDQLVFVPAANLTADTVYTATITAGAQDLVGDPLENSPYTWQFTTAGAVVVVSPEVTSTFPIDKATGVVTNPLVTATFSEAMDPLTLNPETFQLTQGKTLALGGTLVGATIAYKGTTATLTPKAALLTNTLYTALVTDEATDSLGNPLGNAPLVPNPWTFTTGAAAFVPPITLGSTISQFGDFGGGGGITNQGLHTVVNGAIGSTGVSTGITGFHDDSVVILGVPACTYKESTAPPATGLVGAASATPGTGVIAIFTAPGATPPPGTCPLEATSGTPTSTYEIAETASNEAITAYNTLQWSGNNVAGGIIGIAPTGAKGGNLPAELGTLTMDAGTYTNASAVGITSGDLTLDAQNNPNAYWIFQIGTSLTVGAAGLPVSVKLINGAKAANVYWAVGTKAVINYGGGGTMEGTIISLAALTLSSPAQSTTTTATTLLNGRAISLTASTMVNTIITLP